MEITVEKNRITSKITFHIEGRIDARTSQILHSTVRQYDFYTYSNVIFDFTNVEYVTVSGMREFLVLKKRLPYPDQLKIIAAAVAITTASICSKLSLPPQRTKMPDSTMIFNPSKEDMRLASKYRNAAKNPP